ncbi:hypothetical protein [Tepidimonas alkaliphilus]|nr:hypothetical protein [Tepidimonas alkaliphilus]
MADLPDAQRTLVARRLRVLEAAMRYPPLPTGGAAKAILAWWRQGGGLMALGDAPPGRRQHFWIQPWPGWALAIPAGLFRLAAQMRVPVYVYFCTLTRHGHRHIRVEPPILSDQPLELAQHFAALFGNALQQDPAAWHFWPALAALRPDAAVR